MVILIEKGGSSRNLLILVAAYDDVQQRKILPIQEIKADEMEMRKRIMVRMLNRDGEEECRIINPESSSGIYVTASVESQCSSISHNGNMKEKYKIKNTKVYALKRAARINQRAKLFAKLVPYIPNDMMSSEYPSTPFLVQVLLSLSTDIELPDLNKRTVAATILRKWGERIWVMGRDACVS